MGIEKRISNIESFLDLKSPKWRESIAKAREKENVESESEENDK